MTSCTAFASLGAASPGSGVTGWCVPAAVLPVVSTLRIALSLTPFLPSDPPSHDRLIGMSLMYVLQLAGVFQWTVRQFADVENEVVAVERIKEYCLLPPEAALDSGPGQAPPTGWPDKGAIEATGLEVSYRPGLPPVLHGLTFRVEGGQRVGIVGRTGAGKTTVLQVGKVLMCWWRWRLLTHD